ncbi:YqaA family protein [Halorarius halobius]|uniref:YqaA family protein n=1 Tax=Halorarius halobius TaxID=2962671 RepID=UPI0020CEEAAF|nr:VTT domain-containing protein [Halorarius halobius]
MPSIALEPIETLVRTATGPAGLVVVFVYSFLVAFVLPLPGEIVLAAPLRLGLSYPVTLAVIVLVSSVGKALGSVVALHVSRSVTEFAALQRITARLPGLPRFMELRGFVQRHGYVGLALTLCVPLLPDTTSVYAFSVLDPDYRKFAVAAFVGNLGRLLVTLLVVGGLLSLF